MITWTQAQDKMQRLVRDLTPATLEQLQQDYNTGYHLFNAKLARYYTREQQFTNIIADQSIYQTPVNCLRITGLTALVGEPSATSYSWPLKEVRSEYEWRQISSYRTTNNWPTWYMSLGNDQFQVWPIPSQTLTNGFRLYYQPQDYDLSIDDTVSTSANLVTVTNGSVTVTSAGTPFTQSMKGLWFQTTGTTNLTAYEIVDVPDGATLTLKSAFVGFTGVGLSWVVGQLSIIPQEYVDAPMYYALGNYYSSRANESRAQYYRGLFQQMQDDCDQEYSSSQTSSVITDDETYANPFYYPPLPGA